jgi:midasin (ATPase involved in ribosome maturation)
MVYKCTVRTDLDELIGTEHREGLKPYFQYGPLVIAMKRGEQLILENSGALSPLMVYKVSSVLSKLFIAETAEVIRANDGFRLSLR